MFFYFNQSGTALAHSLLHPIIFFNNILQTSFHVITFSSTLGYSDVTGYPWVFSNWGQSLYFISPLKNTSNPKRTSRHCITEDFVGRGRESCIAHHPANTLRHPTWQLHSLCSPTFLLPQHSLSKTTTSVGCIRYLAYTSRPSGLLVYAM